MPALPEPPLAPYTRAVARRSHPGRRGEAWHLRQAERQRGHFGQGHAGEVIGYCPERGRMGQHGWRRTEELRAAINACC